ncbi:unnamed protein product [Bursaphelenchus xylophilus]|uniref:(pine wood nematode) hypothetical protein n=1 Tax=Bursaphelenchus xylophilus TaxID=6326 RepID=A0A1I7RRL2_BURXY|nr:unnamed protein product [Bursaphelenchus xylophilus]CAG9131095.1 unnamed protein product [Bursaphelenchus xylophilus]
MVPQTSSSSVSPSLRPLPSGYRKRKLQSNGICSDNDFSDDDESPKSGSPSIDEDRRAHHNELERRRRDHIKDHFMALKGSIPLLEGEKSSRALILKRAVDYIKMLQTQVKETKTEVEELKRRNETLMQQTTVGLKPFLGQIQLQSAFTPQTTVPVSLCVPSTSTFTVLQEPMLTNHNQQKFKPTYPTPDPVSPAPMASTSSTPVSNLNNLNNLSANLSNLLLQNPSLLAQLQSHPPVQTSHFEPLTPPHSAPQNPSPNFYPELLTPQLLASSLAMRERQFAAVAAAQL